MPAVADRSKEPDGGGRPTRAALRRARVGPLLLVLSVLAACATSAQVPTPSATDAVTGAIGGSSLTATAPRPRSAGGSLRDPARAALDTFIEGLARQDFDQALAASAGAARRMVLVRLVIARHNAARNAETTVAVVANSLSTRTRNDRRVSFTGSVTLRSIVRSAGTAPETTERTIADPVVEPVAGAWRVTTFVWDARPIAGFDGRSIARVGPVEVRLEGAIAFGDVIGVVLLIVAEGEHAVRVETDRLRIGSSEAQAGFRTLIGGQPALLYLSYPRRDARPDEWRGRISVDDEIGEEIALSFA